MVVACDWILVLEHDFRARALASSRGNRSTFSNGALGSNVTPALLLQLHQADDARGNDGGVGDDRDRVAFGLLHALLGVVASRELDLAGKHRFLELLYPIPHWRGVGPQHMQAGTVGDDVDVHVFVLAAIIFDNVGGVVQYQVHDLRIVLVDLESDVRRLAVAGKAGGSKRRRHQGNGRTTK